MYMYTYTHTQWNISRALTNKTAEELIEEQLEVVRDQETKKEFTDWLILTEFQDSLVKMDEELMAVCVCTCACVCMGGEVFVCTCSCKYFCVRVHELVKFRLFVCRKGERKRMCECVLLRECVFVCVCMC